MALTYPETARIPVVDAVCDQEIVDHYRWLEDPDSEETQAWVQQQVNLTNSYLEQCDSRAEIAETLKRVYDYEKYGCPWKSGDFYYYNYNSGLQNQYVMYQQTALDGEATVFFDPNTLSEDGTTALAIQRFSHSGNFFAYGLSESGSDWRTVKVMNCRTKEPPVPREGAAAAAAAEGEEEEALDVLRWVKFTSLAWTHDDGGFFYGRFQPPPKADDLGKEKDQNLFQEVWYHRLGTPQGQDVLVFRDHTDSHPNWMFGPQVSHCGRFLLLSVSESCDPVNALFLLDLQQLPPLSSHDGPLLDQVVASEGPLRKLIDNFDAEYEYLTNQGSLFYFRTNRNAPLYRVICIDIDNPSEENWKEIIPEHEVDVLDDVGVINNDILWTNHLHDVAAKMQLWRLEDGTKIQEIPFPTLGSLVGVTGKHDDTMLFFKFTSFTYPGSTFYIDFAAGPGADGSFHPQLFRETSIDGFAAEDFVTSQVFYNSDDGTRIPMFVIHPRDFEQDGDAICFLYAYGGFNISLTPSFSPFRCAFLKGYGKAMVAIPNIRGGGEYGEQWHKAGTKDRKQNCFDDFRCAAEYLAREGYTRPEKTAICGGSNGGLLVGASLTQHPECFGCCLAQVGVLDMLRFHKFTIGHYWTSDYGNPDDPEHFPHLLRYSPYHNVRKGKAFPPTLLLTADHDDRVVPLHSFKFAAELQHQLGAEPYQTAPLLIRIEQKAGHGAGKPTAKIIEEIADMYAFIGKSCGGTFQA